MRVPTPRVLLWDLDGTLVDTIPDLEGAIRSVRRSEGLPDPPRGLVRRSVGDGARKLVERCFPGTAPEEIERLHRSFLAAYGERPAASSRAYRGIAPLLRRLHDRGRIQAVVTNKPEDLARRVVDRLLPGSVFAVVRGARAGSALKPSPEPLLEVLEELDRPAEEAWMVGDHVTDLRSGRAAGCVSVFCRWGYGRRDGAEPDLEVDSVEDLERLLHAASDSDSDS